MPALLLLATVEPAATEPGVITAWDQLVEAITNYKVVGTAGLLALLIGVIVSVIKRFGAGGPSPNWWVCMPRLGRTMLVASLGALAGVLASIQGGANPGQAIVLGLSGVLSILGHELAQKYGLAGKFVSDPARTPETSEPDEE